jgi:hypothetical protein
MDDAIATVQLRPKERRKIPTLDYTGALLLRWQVLKLAPGVALTQLKAAIDSRLIINPVGHLPKGSWEFPAGDQNFAPLAEIFYTPAQEWYVTTPEGFTLSNLILYPYTPPIYQLPNMGTINYGAAMPQTIDLTPVVTAINNNGTYEVAMMQQLGQLVRASEPGQNTRFEEILAKEWQGNSSNHEIRQQDPNRRSVVITVPKSDLAGNPNTQEVRIGCGSTPRNNYQDATYSLRPGDSVELNREESAQTIAMWQDPNTGSTSCNWAEIYT